MKTENIMQSTRCDPETEIDIIEHFTRARDEVNQYLCNWDFSSPSPSLSYRDEEELQRDENFVGIFSLLGSCVALNDLQIMMVSKSVLASNSVRELRTAFSLLCQKAKSTVSHKDRMQHDLFHHYIFPTSLVPFSISRELIKINLLTPNEASEYLDLHKMVFLVRGANSMMPFDCEHLEETFPHNGFSWQLDHVENQEHNFDLDSEYTRLIGQFSRVVSQYDILIPIENLTLLSSHAIRMTVATEKIMRQDLVPEITRRLFGPHSNNQCEDRKIIFETEMNQRSFVSCRIGVHRWRKGFYGLGFNSEIQFRVTILPRFSGKERLCYQR